MDDLAVRLGVHELIGDYAERIDEDRLEEWPDLFADPCRYLVISRANHEAGMRQGVMYAASRGMLLDRVFSIRRANIFEPHRYRHVVGPIRLKAVEGAVAVVHSHFLAVRIMHDGATTLFASGRYLDRIDIVDDRRSGSASGSWCWTATRSIRCWRSRCSAAIPTLPLPLREGVGGRGLARRARPPPPNPLPQGEGEMSRRPHRLDDEADIRLDRWFRRHFPGLTQGAIQKLCRTGQVRVDGHRADAATRLAAGQSVRIPPLPAAARGEAAAARDRSRAARDLQRLVIYRDDHLLVLNKPHGMPVQGGPGITHHLDALLDALRFGSPDRPRLVHRLDRDTSGVLLLARTPGTAAKLAAAFRSRAVEKTYWAVVARRPVPVGRPHRPAAAAHRRRPRRTHRDGRTRRQGRRPRHHRLPHARSCRAEAGLAGTVAADRPHPPAPRPLRRDRRADPGRCEIRAARPEQCLQRHGRRGSQANFTCMRARFGCPIPPVEHCWWRRTCRPT